jgi:hypothetical protein
MEYRVRYNARKAERSHGAAGGLSAMEIRTTGTVVVSARAENLGDIYLSEHGLFPRDRVRAAEIPEALVDPDARMLSLPRRLVRRLGLDPGRTHVFRKSLSCKDLQSSARNSTSRKFFADKDL